MDTSGDGAQAWHHWDVAGAVAAASGDFLQAKLAAPGLAAPPGLAATVLGGAAQAAASLTAAPRTPISTPVQTSRLSPMPGQPIGSIAAQLEATISSTSGGSNGGDASFAEARSPELRTYCPQPRRPFLPFFDAHGLSNPASPSPSQTPPCGRELSELLGGTAEPWAPYAAPMPCNLGWEAGSLKLIDSRPLSSLSTAADPSTVGPTPSLDDTTFPLSAAATEQYVQQQNQQQQSGGGISARPSLPPGLDLWPDSSETTLAVLTSTGEGTTVCETTLLAPAPVRALPAAGDRVADVGSSLSQMPMIVRPSSRLSRCSTPLLSTCSSPPPCGSPSAAVQQTPPPRNAFLDHMLPYDQIGRSNPASTSAPAQHTSQPIASSGITNSWLQSGSATFAGGVSSSACPGSPVEGPTTSAAGGRQGRRGRRGGKAADTGAETNTRSGNAGTAGAEGSFAATAVNQRKPGVEGQSTFATGSGNGKAGAAGKKASDRAAADADRLTVPTVVSMSTTQVGSKLLQRKLLKGHPNVIKDILDGIETELPALMCDMYGNYLCSAAFQACSMSQRQRMLKIACSPQNFGAVATDKWGTHALQALISLVCTTQEQELLYHTLRMNVSELSCDPNGMHVVQRAFISFGPDFAAMILTEVTKNLSIVAHNPHGLCILKKCITVSRSTPSQQFLLQEMTCRALELIQGPYSNYAVQHALEEWGGETCMPIVQALRGWLAQLSIQKFSSNVVEHMLRLAPADAQRHMIEELSSPEHTAILVSTVYGHFVARRVLRAASTEQKASLERAIAQNLGSLRNRRLRTRMERALRGEPDSSDDEAADNKDDVVGTEQSQSAGRGAAPRAPYAAGLVTSGSAGKAAHPVRKRGQRR